MVEDMLATVAAVYEENRTLQHSFAMREFIEDVAIPAEALRSMN